MFLNMRECDACYGTGVVRSMSNVEADRPCSACYGTGREPTDAADALMDFLRKAKPQVLLALGIGEEEKQ